MMKQTENPSKQTRLSPPLIRESRRNRAAPLLATATRYAAYRSLFGNMVVPANLAAIQAHTQQQRAWRSDRFRALVEALARRAADVRLRGRPRPARSAGNYPLACAEFSKIHLCPS